MKILLILTILLTSVNILAVTPINKGEVAPHSGYIFSKTEEKAVRKIREEKLRLEDLNILKNRKIGIQKKRIDLLKQRLDNAKIRSWEKWVYIGIGVLATSAAVYGASKLIRR